MPTHKIGVPDPSLRCRSWGEIPKSTFKYPRGVPHAPPVIAQDGHQSRERPCARCGKTFATSATNRLLCRGCYLYAQADTRYSPL